MAIVEVDQTPPNIWQNEAFRYGLLVTFILFILGSCYCSFALRVRRRAPFADALFISLVERSRAARIPLNPPTLLEAWVYGRGKAGWRDMKPLCGERIPHSSAASHTVNAEGGRVSSLSSDLQVAVLIAMPSAHPRTSTPDKLDEDLPLDERLGGSLAFGVATLPADTKSL